MKLQRERIRKIVEAYFKTDLPPQLENEILAWLFEFKDDEVYQAVLEEFWCEEVTENLNPDPSLEEDFAKLALSLHFPQKRNKKRVAKYVRRGLIAVASMAAVLALVLGVWFFMGDEKVSEVEYLYSAVSSDQHVEVEMGDGTKIVLNEDSEILYNENRECRLSGEGYFRVPKDETTFNVTTESINIYVLGTEFNLDAYPNKPYSVVTLYSGLLRLEIGNSEYILEAGNELIYNNATSEVSIEEFSKTEERKGPSWALEKEELSVYKLNDIFDSIESMFGVTIVNRDAVNTEHRYSFYFDRNDPIDMLISTLETASGEFRYSIEDDKIILESIK